MGWFDEQLRLRKQKDDENFEDAFLGIAGAIVGDRIGPGLAKDEMLDAALDEIIRYYGEKPSSDEIPQQVNTTEDQIEYRMRPYGFMYRQVKLDEGWYMHSIGPMLGSLKDEDVPVVMLPRRFFGYDLVELSTGKRYRIDRKTDELIDREATMFYQPLPQKKLTMLDLIRYMFRQTSVFDLVLSIGGMALTTAVGLVSANITKWLFGDVLESRDYSMLIAMAVFMLCYSLSRLLIQIYQSFILQKINIRQQTAVQAAVTNRILTLPMGFFKDYSSGELLQRSMYVSSLCSTLMNTIANTTLTSLFSLVYIGQIFSFAPALVVPALISTAAMAALSVITAFVQMKITREQMELGSKESGMSYAMITGMQKIKLAGAEKRMFSRWARLYTKEARLMYNPPLLIRINPAISLAISLGGMYVLYLTAIRTGISVADFSAFNTAYAMVSGAFMSLAGIATTIAGIKPTLEMARPIMEAEPERSDNREIVSAIRGEIEIDNVSFRYMDSQPMVIDDLSLKIRPGEYVAIVGSTGCGKSTLMRLLLGFEHPISGSIYYDGKDTSRIDMRSLRRKIGVVLQDGKLLSGSIYSNIVISAPQLGMTEAWEAAEIASVAEDIRNMPMGMHTMISEGQGGISGGQKQRLMIARAVAHKPKIIMFDEATSALDNVTQKKVAEAIDKLKCTRVVIAHRLSTIRHCDRIIVLDKGKIAESGTYEELIANNGFFADLVARQRLDIEE